MTFFASCVHVCKLWLALPSSQLIIFANSIIAAEVLGVTLVLAAVWYIHSNRATQQRPARKKDTSNLSHNEAQRRPLTCHSLLVKESKSSQRVYSGSFQGHGDYIILKMAIIYILTQIIMYMYSK